MLALYIDHVEAAELASMKDDSSNSDNTCTSTLHNGRFDPGEVGKRGLFLDQISHEDT